MAIPEIKKNDILEAIKYIDENGVPPQNQSTKYELITEDGKKYPPKYVIAVADHLVNRKDISTSEFDAGEAKDFLQKIGFRIQPKQYELTITADNVVSTDKRFSMDNLGLGDQYKPLDAYFQKVNGEIIKRKYIKGERKSSNQTMPKLACQIFETQLAELSVEDGYDFPICKYTPDSEIICGIYSSIDEFKKHRNSIEFATYNYDNGKIFVFYCWNIFSTIIFVQECLKRFGESGDKFVLTYQEKNEKKELQTENEEFAKEDLQQYKNHYSSMLIKSKNIIFRGAPGTGKSYLAKKIAADIISNGNFDDYSFLTDKQKQQVEFVQFHPSYDYSDFVEGLRPKINDDGSMGFELQDGIFKKFVSRAIKNYENSKKPVETIEKELSIQESMEEFFSNIKLGIDKFKTINGNEFTITNIDDKRIYVSIPNNAIVKKLCLNLDDIRKMLESGEKFEKIKDIKDFFGKTDYKQAYSYDFAIYREIMAKQCISSITVAEREKLKKFIFIIDEINRGEISKIFGELFFAVDPGYRGKVGEVSTQYANLHSDHNEKFYIPENVYIIGTMNDIDRSVDSFDFAMRRRFRFIELKADEHLEMLDSLDDAELKAEAIKRMSALNKEIANIEDLNENYQIGASYFLKLKTLNFDELWTDYLKPLLREYVQGMYDEKSIMKKLEKAYGYNAADEGTNNDDA